MNRIASAVSFLALLILIGCGSVSSTRPAAEFSEDITVYRNSYELPTASVEPELMEADNKAVVAPFNPERDITYSLDSLLDSVSVYNQKKKYYQGFTIQVYTGTSSEEANEVRKELYSVVPSERSKISYEIPNYKVKVGEYYTRLEAAYTYTTIKRAFPAAILVPQQFAIEE